MSCVRLPRKGKSLTQEEAGQVAKKQRKKRVPTRDRDLGFDRYLQNISFKE